MFLLHYFCRVAIVNIVLLLPLMFMAPLSLIGGSFATALAESVYTKEIFDQVIHRAPSINQTFHVKGKPLNVSTLKAALR